MTRETTIRSARPDDLPQLQAVEAAAGQLFREVGIPAVAKVADDLPPTLDELAAAPALLVAVDPDDRAVGYARVEVVGGGAHLEQLSVLPSHGGRGIGTALLDAAADWARARGDAAITLTTFRHVPFNAPIYARRGFDEVPAEEWPPALRALVEEEAAHGLDPDLRVVMRRPLR